MSTIVFIRHGETDMAGSFCGHSDPELNLAGKRQAIRLAGEAATLEDMFLKLTEDTTEAVEYAIRPEK